MAMRTRMLQVLAGALIGLALTLGASAPASESTTGQLTNNSTDDLKAAISGSNVVTQDCDGGTGPNGSGGTGRPTSEWSRPSRGPQEEGAICDAHEFTRLFWW
jgi:hypothetical protein